MSEKIFALLLRLYPARFRQRYRDEAIQFLRDRLREERGSLRRLRLWIDLLIDLAWGLPQAYRNTYSSAATLLPAEKAGGIPAFRMLEHDPLRPGTFLMGSMGTLAIFGLLVFVMNHAGPYRSEEKGSLSSIERVMQRLNQPLTPGSSSRANVSPSSPPSSVRPEVSPHALKSPISPHTPSEAAALSPPPALRMAAPPPLMHPAAKDQRARNPERRAQRPIPAPPNEQAASAQASGPVRPLTRQFDNSMQGMPLARRYSPDPGSGDQLRALAVTPTENPTSTAPRNCMVEELKTLAGNVGYVKLSWFADPAVCRSTAEQVMYRLNANDAVIFDLRDCTGGYPEMVRLMASWLFDRPVPWYNPRATSPAELVTESPVPGSRLAGKPVFVLTSSRTFSGAEHFAYNLKKLKRATLVGETTSGASHARLGTPLRQAANPDSKPVWEGTGVKPEVQVKAADALNTAEKLALAAVHRH